MITPVNGHLLIEPVKQQSFISTSDSIFEEIGIVLDIGDEALLPTTNKPKVGDKVYFDSWLAAKFPKNDTEYYWLVEWKDVRAIEHVE